MTNQQLAEAHPAAYMRYYKAVDRVRVDNAAPRNFKSGVIVIHGPMGTGKSGYAHRFFRGEYYKKQPSTPWWDGYTGQSTVWLDEFTGAPYMAYGLLKEFLDRYDYMVQVKGGQVHIRAKTIIITSNISPDQWYKYSEIVKGRSGDDTMAELFRRINWCYRMDRLCEPVLEFSNPLDDPDFETRPYVGKIAPEFMQTQPASVKHVKPVSLEYAIKYKIRSGYVHQGIMYQVFSKGMIINGEDINVPPPWLQGEQELHRPILCLPAPSPNLEVEAPVADTAIPKLCTPTPTIEEREIVRVQEPETVKKPVSKDNNDIVLSVPTGHSSQVGLYESQHDSSSSSSTHPDQIDFRYFEQSQCESTGDSSDSRKERVSQFERLYKGGRPGYILSDESSSSDDISNTKKRQRPVSSISDDSDFIRIDAGIVQRKINFKRSKK